MGNDNMNKVNDLFSVSKTWLVTGCAGFIGSHIVERLLKHGQTVHGIDSFATGFKENIDLVKKAVGDDAAERFKFVEGDILDMEAVSEAMEGVDVVSHQAALGSVPRSIEKPVDTVRANVDGFMSIVKGAVDADVKRIVYASSSAIYGDHPGLPKVEDETGSLLSPYAASKAANEIFADASSNAYGLEFIGLRYFNVFGPRQDPEGAYAAVIPKWVVSLIKGEETVINGDPSISRDFTYVSNVVDANILAAYAKDDALNDVYNIANGGRMTLGELHSIIVDILAQSGAINGRPTPKIGPERGGDIKHSNADVSKARRGLGFVPAVESREGLELIMPWYLNSSIER